MIVPKKIVKFRRFDHVKRQIQIITKWLFQIKNYAMFILAFDMVKPTRIMLKK